MELVKINISPLPFYDSITMQNHRKDYAFGNIYPLITYRNMLLPFQVIVADGSDIGYVRLHDLSGKYVDITESMINNGLALKQYSGFKLIKYPGILPIYEISREGFHYLSINIVNLGTIYSDVFTVTNRVSDYLLIKYSNTYNFELKGGIVDFSDGFEFNCYLNTQVGKPEYSFEEEATQRMGYTYIESQVSKKIYKFTFVAPEYLCDALRIIRLCDTKQIISKLQIYEPLTFSMDPEWQEQGDLASVECEFETDNIVANIGGYEHTLLNDYNDDFNNDYN